MPLTLDGLRTTLHDSLQNGQLVLLVDLLQSSSVDQLAAAYFPDRTIRLDAVAAPPEEVRSDGGRQTAFTVRGQGVDAPFKNLTTTLAVTFFSDTAEVRLRMAATAEAGWAPTSSFPSLA